MVTTDIDSHVTSNEKADHSTCDADEDDNIHVPMNEKDNIDVVTSTDTDSDITSIKKADDSTCDADEDDKMHESNISNHNLAYDHTESSASDANMQQSSEGRPPQR